MSKRRRLDMKPKISQFNNHEDLYQNDDYTADYELFNFLGNGAALDNGGSHDRLIRPSIQDYYGNEHKDVSNSSSIVDDQNNENLCRDFVRNVCRRGLACKYKHSSPVPPPCTSRSEAIPNGNQFEVNFCHDYQNNGCSRPQCRFIHCNRPEQEFYYATGILLPSVPCNNVHMPVCKDFLNGACSRVKCKYLHMKTDEMEQPTNHPTSDILYNQGSNIDPNNMHPNANNAYYPSNKISLGNNQPLTNAQFTVSLPIGSVSYSTSQPLISQPNLTNVQYIHDPILSSVAHGIQPQFTLLSSADSQSHSQIISGAPMTVEHPSLNQQYTISQQPPVGVSIFSVAAPCSLLPAPSTAFQQQHQIRSYDQNDQSGLFQNNLKTTIGNMEYTIKDNVHLGSTLTPIYIQHSLPSAVPLTQYRVTALESTAPAGIVIHNPIDRANLTFVHANNSNHAENTRNVNGKSQYLSNGLPDGYSKIIEENESLKKRLIELEKQTCDLQTANELLLDQNARLRNIKSCGNGLGNEAPQESKQSSQNLILSPSGKNQRCTNRTNNNRDVVSNGMSEMATITLTVPIGSVLSAVPQGADSSLSAATSNPHPLHSVGSRGEYNGQNVLSTSVHSDHISPTLVTTALRSIQQTVMPTLHALVASSNNIGNGQSISNLKYSTTRSGYSLEGLSDVEVPQRASSCPVTYSCVTTQDKPLKSHQSTGKVGCTLGNVDIRRIPQLCFQ